MSERFTGTLSLSPVGIKVSVFRLSHVTAQGHVLPPKSTTVQARIFPGRSTCTVEDWQNQVKYSCV